MNKRELLKLLNQLGKATEKNDIELCSNLVEQLENNLPFKDKEQKGEWLDVVATFKCYEDFEELTRKIINQRTPKNKKVYTLIHDDFNLYLDENKEYIIEILKEQEMEVNDQNIEDYVNASLENKLSDFDYMLNNFDKKVDYDDILVIAQLGLWYGQRNSQRYFKTLKSAFYTCTEDTNYLYSRNNTHDTITLKAIHHDGSNFFKFYKIKNGKKKAITIQELQDLY